MLAVFIAVIIFIIFAILGIAFIIGWQSALRDNDILIGVFFMWTVVAILIVIILLAAKYR